MADPVYLDNAATTPVDPRVFEAMRPLLARRLGQPVQRLRRRSPRAARAGRRARPHRPGAELPRQRDHLHQLRQRERQPGDHAAPPWRRPSSAAGSTSSPRAIEHHAVLHACEWLETAPRASRSPTSTSTSTGASSPATVAAAVRPDTALVSIMYANNEIGTVEPIAEIARAVKAANPATLVHTDAVQAGGLLPLDVAGAGRRPAGALGAQVLRAQRASGCCTCGAARRWCTS